MANITRMGYNSTHKDGINFERPNGSSSYLFLLIKSNAYFEFTPEQMEHSLNTLSANNDLPEMPFKTDTHSRHTGLIRQTVEHPSFILYTPNVPQYYYYNGIYINDWIVFEGNEMPELLEELNIPVNSLTTLHDHTEISSLIGDLMKEFHQTGSHHQNIMDAKLKTILYKFSDIYHLETRLSDKLKQHRKAFGDLRNDIYNNNTPEKTIAELASEVNLSVSYFEHIYKEIFGVSPNRDIIKSRIDKACHLLRLSTCPITAIAECCGYENVEHFNRQFKKITGLTPTQYIRY